jgi:cytochrome c peroxidase
MRFAVLLFLLLLAAPAAALPPVPEPAENPTTEDKRILGKILFWDEQLSSDNTVACGSCHLPAFGGADPRYAEHPGDDGVLGTRDDTLGSPGIQRHGSDGNRILDPIFRTARQVTDRAAPSVFGGLWAETLFWDGRAGPAFVDPLTEQTLITSGGGLEAQALHPLMSPVEMAREGRTWADLTEKLAAAHPLALADRWPPDIAALLDDEPSYPELFDAAFGDPGISPARIAFALAAYQRTLVADQTPFDLAEAGGPPLSFQTQMGLSMFKQQRCDVCHVPPLFTNDGYFNIGLRPARDDAGRMTVTGDAADAGRVRVPNLRNVGLRPRLMHTGEIATIEEALGLYQAPRAQRDPLPGGGEYRLNQGAGVGGYIATFLREALTDPRVAAEEFPFDRPRLRADRAPVDFRAPSPPTELSAEPVDGGVRLSWAPAEDDFGVIDYVVRREGAVIGYATGTVFLDPDGLAGAGYSVIARDAPARESEAASVVIEAGEVDG